MKTLSKAIIFIILLVFAFQVAANAQGPKSDKNVCPGANGLTAAEVTDLLTAQNNARAEFKLTPLSWDCKLADFAQAWATRGIFEHREGNQYGENIFVASNTETPATAAVVMWMMERPFWNNKTAACQEGKICDHYTQLVWKQTTQVGCGINRKAPGKWKLLLVCNFSPQGNLPGAAY